MAVITVRKVWYKWFDDIYDDIWQFGLYIDQIGYVVGNEKFPTNTSAIDIKPIVKNISDTAQTFPSKFDFSISVDNSSVRTATIDDLYNRTISPNMWDGPIYDTSFYPIEHDMYGTKTITLNSSIKIANSSKVFSLNLLLDLVKIDLSNVVFTELTDIDKEAFHTGYVTLKTRVIVLPDGNNEELVLTEKDAVKSWSIEEERYVPDNGFIGQFVARTLDGELQNISDNFNIENREVDIQLGIIQMGSSQEDLISENGMVLTTEDNEKVVNRTFDDDVIRWYSLGKFLITKPEDDEVNDNTKYEGFDYAVKFNKDFNADWKKYSDTLSFNETIKQGGYFTALELAQYVCDQVGVKLATTTFSNSNFVIKSNQFTEGNSCRDVMKAIAQLAYGWCRIGWDNKLYIDEPILALSAISKYETISNDNYYSLTTQKEKYGPINRVIVGPSGIDGEGVNDEDIQSIEENGLHELYVYDNPITYTEDLRNLSLNYASNLFGFNYIPFESETPGHLWLKAYQPIKIIDMEGNEKYTYPFNNTINYTGHVRTSLSAPASTEQEVTTSYNTNIYKTLRDVKIQVDKQEGIITITNAKATAAANGLSSLETRFNQEITDTYSKQQIQEIVNGTSEDGTVVSSVTTTAGTFDKNGLTIEQSAAATKTNVNADGMIIYNKTSSITDPLLIVNSNGVIAKNVKVSTYLNIGTHSRLEDYTHTDYSQGTGVFWIGSDY